MQDRMGAMNDEMLDELDEELDDEMDDEFDDELDEELDDEFDDELSSELDEETEMELAAELLELESEADLEGWFSNLARRVGSGVRSFAQSPIGRSAIGALKGVAKRALPVAGRALGNYVAPGIGGQVGGALGSWASSLFEIEMEAMSPEDAEFEVARRVVRLSAKTLKNASAADKKIRRAGKPVSRRVAKTVAKNSLKKAAVQVKRVIRPVKVVNRPVRTVVSSAIPNAGRWVKRGRRIIIYL